METNQRLCISELPLRETGKDSFTGDVLARTKTALRFFELVKQAIDDVGWHV